MQDCFTRPGDKDDQLSRSRSLENEDETLLSPIQPGGTVLKADGGQSGAVCLKEILLESTKTPEFSYLSCYMLPKSKRFVWIKQQSFLFDEEMCRLVMVQDVTQILL